MTAFQRALLGTIAGAALVIALVLAAKQPSPAGAGSLGVGANDARLAAGALPGGGLTPGIVVSGDATVKALPDIAVLTIGVTTQARTAADAQSALAERMGRVLQRAKDLRIADRDTKSAGYTISPQYAQGPGQAPTITGYQASQSVTLTLREVSGVGKALDAFVQGDAATNVQIRFALDDAKAKQAEARRLAIEDARTKAKAMADAAGVRLGKVLSVSESSSAPGPLFDEKQLRSVAGVATTVPVGELDVVVHVQLQFAID